MNVVKMQDEDDLLFQKVYGFEKPVKVLEWGWSDTFGRWGALVVFEDGREVFTWPNRRVSNEEVSRWRASRTAEQNSRSDSGGR